jgi:hypothetical protein
LPLVPLFSTDVIAAGAERGAVRLRTGEISPGPPMATPFTSTATRRRVALIGRDTIDRARPVLG